MLTFSVPNTNQFSGPISIPSIDQGLIEYIRPNLEHGPWIAGGAVWRWYRGRAINSFTDIDVFFRDPAQFNLLNSKLRLGSNNEFDSGDPLFISDNAATYSFNGYRIQLIKRNFYDNVDALLNKFDIIACKIATDGCTWVTNHNLTVQHIENSILDMIDPLQPGAIKRFLKYWVYGFTPKDSLIARLQQAENLDRNFFMSNDYDHI